VWNGEESGESVVEGGTGGERAVFDELPAEGGVEEEEAGGEEVSVELLDVGEGGAPLDQRVQVSHAHWPQFFLCSGRWVP
jgi:hypothetical protein